MANSNPEQQEDTQKGAVRDRMVHVLRQAIFAGEFQPGEKLVERKLCEKMGASRTALRESLRQLEAEGLIDNIPNRGPIVPRLTVDDARQIYELRSVLEAYLAKVAADRANGNDIAELQNIFRNITTTLSQGDRSAIIAAKTAYYEWMLRLADNAEFSTVLWRLLARMSLIWPMVSARSAHHAEGNIAEIKQIVDAIAVHDGVAAAAAVRQHLASAEAAIVAHLSAPTT